MLRRQFTMFISMLLIVFTLGTMVFIIQKMAFQTDNLVLLKSCPHRSYSRDAGSLS